MAYLPLIPLFSSKKLFLFCKGGWPYGMPPSSGCVSVLLLDDAVLLWGDNGACSLGNDNDRCPRFSKSSGQSNTYGCGERALLSGGVSELLRRLRWCGGRFRPAVLPENQNKEANSLYANIFSLLYWHYFLQIWNMLEICKGFLRINISK